MHIVKCAYMVNLYLHMLKIKGLDAKNIRKESNVCMIYVNNKQNIIIIYNENMIVNTFLLPLKAERRAA